MVAKKSSTKNAASASKKTSKKTTTKATATKTKAPAKKKATKKAATKETAKPAKASKSKSKSKKTAADASAPASDDKALNGRSKTPRELEAEADALLAAAASSETKSGGGQSNGKVDELISLGKSKGFLTYDEVNDALPGDDVGTEQMDAVLSALDGADIELVDSTSNVKPARPAKAQADTTAAAADNGKAATTTTTTSTTKKESSSDDSYYKSNDPVRMYLRKMGSVALLTREGEVEIAKRIEEGENEVLDVSCGAQSPSGRSSKSASGSGTTRSESRTSSRMLKTRSRSSTKRKPIAASFA